MTLPKQRRFVLTVLMLLGAICAMSAALCGCATMPRQPVPIADTPKSALLLLPEAVILPDLAVALTITPLVITNSPIRSNTSSISMEKCSPSCVLLTIHCDEGATPMLQDSHDLLSWSSWYFVSNNLQFVSETGNSNRFIRLKNQ